MFSGLLAIEPGIGATQDAYSAAFAYFVAVKPSIGATKVAYRNVFSNFFAINQNSMHAYKLLCYQACFE